MFKMRPLFFSVLVILALIPLVPDILSDPPNQPLGDFVIPTWVKSTAGWWSDDKIPDVSLVESIEFMMKDFISEFNNLYNISEIIEKDNWDKFIGLNDSIIHQHTYKEELNSNENKMKNIINMITSRNLYRSIGELLIECSPSDCNSPEESKIK